jgi:hypothetical protein
MRFMYNTLEALSLAYGGYGHFFDLAQKALEGEREAAQTV